MLTSRYSGHTAALMHAGELNSEVPRRRVEY